MAHTNSDLLFSHLLDRAQALLEKNSEIYPIAAMITPQSEIRPVMVYWGDEHPSSQKVIDELSVALISQASSKSAAALGLAYDIRFAESEAEPMSDAIKIDLERISGESISVITPYKKMGGRIRFGNSISESKPLLWFKAAKSL